MHLRLLQLRERDGDMETRDSRGALLSEMPIRNITFRITFRTGPFTMKLPFQMWILGTLSYPSYETLTQITGT